MTSAAQELQQSVPPASGRTADVVNRLARALATDLSPGELSQLRRMEPHDPGCPAFWRLVIQILEPSGALPMGDPREAAEVEWAAVLSAMVRLAGSHDPKIPLGRALAAAGYSELRLVRLLRSHGEQLGIELRKMATYLASKGERADLTLLASLIRSHDPQAAERIRRRLARDYYGYVHASAPDA